MSAFIRVIDPKSRYLVIEDDVNVGILAEIQPEKALKI